MQRRKKAAGREQRTETRDAQGEGDNFNAAGQWL